MRGTHLEVRHEGEGWFPGVEDKVIGGTIEEDLGHALGHGRWYIVRLDRVLELQESGHATPSGYRLVPYRRLLLSPRLVGEDLTQGRAVSTFVCLVPENTDPLECLRSIRSPDLWASCTLGA